MSLIQSLSAVTATVTAALRAARGWRRLGWAFVAGLVSVLALPPLFVLPVLLVSIPALLTLLEGAERTRSAFAIGWAFGFGSFVGGLYWIAHALLLDPLRFGWMIPFAVGGLSAVLAVYPGLCTALLHRLRWRGLARLGGLAALWTVMEVLRGLLFTGFPWNPLGSVWSGLPLFLQGASLIGVSGLSLLTVLLAGAPLFGRRGWLALGAGVAAMALLGAVRLPPEPMPTVEGVRLRLVQPSIPQTMKWAEGARQENLNRYLSLSQLPGLDGSPTHILWGETAVPYAMDGQSDAVLRAVLAAPLAVHAPPAGETRGGDVPAGRAPAPGVIIGAIRRTPPGQEPFQIWNSLLALDASGALTASFDKAHLVPFGEYVPFKSVLPLQKITVGAVDYSPGPGPRTIDIPGLPPVGPLICYEVIFPGAVVDPARRPDWLLNLTNDGWYGLSSGPYQHLQTAVLRAVEEGLPLVRVANTGVSAVIDPYGRTTAAIGLGQAGYVDAALPRPLPPTLFSRFGLLVPLLLAGLVLAVSWLLGRKCDRTDVL